MLDSGKHAAVTVKNLLETLCKPDQNPLFYAGGIEILTEMMKDCKPGMRMAWPCEYSQCIVSVTSLLEVEVSPDEAKNPYVPSFHK